MLRVKMMLRSVLCSNVSRCLSCGPVLAISGADAQALRVRTSDTHRRPHVDLDRRFLGHLIAPEHLDGPVHGADDAVAAVCIGRRPVCTVQVREYSLGRHGERFVVWALRALSR
jgi:hypothetical protein